MTEGRDIKPDEAAKQLEAIFANPFEAATRLRDVFGALTDAEQAMLQKGAETGDANKALAASIDVVADRYEKAHAQRLRDIDEAIRQAKVNLDAAMAMGDAGAAAIEQTQKQIGALEAERAKITATNDELRKKAGILNTTQTSAEQLRERFDDVLKSIAPWTSELEKAQGAIAALRAGLQGSTGDAAALVRQFEGFTDKAKIDTDGRYRVGYGSDTTTSASGQVSPVSSETTTSREDAERDLARRIVEFQTEAARQIGPAWARLTDEAKASITSVTYNYGHVPGSVVSAAQTGGNAEIAGAIGSLSANPGRRAQEAANITAPATAAVTDAGKIGQANEAIAEQKDKILAIDQAKSGGTEIDKAQLANLQAEVAGRKDDIAATERLIAATRRSWRTSSTAERAKLTEGPRPAASDAPGAAERGQGGRAPAFCRAGPGDGVTRPASAMLRSPWPRSRCRLYGAGHGRVQGRAGREGSGDPAVRQHRETGGDGRRAGRDQVRPKRDRRRRFAISIWRRRPTSHRAAEGRRRPGRACARDCERARHPKSGIGAR